MKNKSQACIMVLFTICNLIWIERLDVLLVLAAVLFTLIIAGADIYKNFSAVDEYMIMIFSISAMLIEVVLLWHYMIDDSFDFLIKGPIESGAIISWLLLVALVNTAAYCIYDGKQIWHGANAAVCFLILIIQKNILSLFMLVIMLLAIPCIYRPVRKIVRRDIQLLTVYMLMMCNMTFLSSYTDLIIGAPEYDLRTSIYTEVAFGVFVLIFFIIWFRENKKHRHDELERIELMGIEAHIDVKYPMKQVRGYFKSVIITLTALVIACIVMLIKGDEQPIFESLSFSMSSQAGLFDMLGHKYGALGIIFTAALFLTLAWILTDRRRVRSTRTQKLARFIAIAYSLQSLFLTQTIGTTTTYLIFTAAYINSVRLSLRDTGDDNLNEANDSDTVLQRSEDIGDSAQ